MISAIRLKPKRRRFFLAFGITGWSLTDGNSNGVAGVACAVPGGVADGCGLYEDNVMPTPGNVSGRRLTISKPTVGEAEERGIKPSIEETGLCFLCIMN